MKSTKKSGLLAACALLTATSLTLPMIRQAEAKKAPPKPQQADKPNTSGSDEYDPSSWVRVNIPKVAKSNNAFAVDLYQHFKEESGNIFFSPYSVSSALGMTYAGAKGDTAAGMEKALHLSVTGSFFHQALSGLTKNLQDDATKNKYQLSVANQLWGDVFFQKYFLESFVRLNKELYGAPMATVDFKKSKEAADQINKWVSEKTNKRIPSIVSKENFEGNDPTALVLTNAIYFKGNWASQFRKESTQKEDFFVTEKKKIKADLMYQQGDFRYAETKDAQIIALPYQGESLEMVIVLPTQKEGLSALEKTLTAASLETMTASLYTEDVKVKLPKFTFDKSFTLNEPLKALGMKDAFNSSKADFSGMADLEKLSLALGGPTKLYIQSVLHKAFIEVNEEGSEAAGATAVIIGVHTESVKIPSPPKVFTADHPFLFMIRDVQSGAILFMGRVSNPS